MIRVYTAPGCGPCFAVKRALAKAGLAFEALRLADHPELVEVWRAARHVEAPITTAGDRVWSGFQPGMVEDLVAVSKCSLVQ